jgi:hypothetical protein
MEKAESKETALLALRKIRERLDPPRTLQDASKAEPVEEVCQGVRIRDDVERGFVQMFFPQVPEEKVRRYMKNMALNGWPGSSAGKASGR